VAVAGTATCVIAGLSVGAHSITAIYSGDANFNPSTSAPLTQTVNMGNTNDGADFVGQPFRGGTERHLHKPS